jgi:nucleoid-associated protein YgaU
MVARPYLLSVAALFTSALLFIATGCEKKNDAPAAPINPPTASTETTTTAAPDLKSLPTDDPYAPGTSTKPIGSAGTSTGTLPGAGAAPVGGGKVHVLAKGDTLFGLCRTYYGQATNANVAKILAANPQIKDKNHIPVGTKITIP